MRKTSHLIVLIGLALTLLLTSACLSSRTIMSFEDHHHLKVTMMETLDVYTVVPFFFYEARFQFWQCEDSGNGLSCEKVCDGATDLTCPSSSISYWATPDRHAGNVPVLK